MTALPTTAVRPIETLYKGFRFRSRLEARWAVFFDAAGIEWNYEVEGFDIGGRCYLPDFWLPKFDAFVEVKPNIEACEPAEPTIRSLVMAIGHRVILLAGSPNIIEPPQIFDFRKAEDWDDAVVRKNKISFSQCVFCDGVYIEGQFCTRRECASDVAILKCPRGTTPRVDHAMGEAQRARFEHGEDGKPRPYLVTAPTTPVRVYTAGPVIEITEKHFKSGTYEQNDLLPWRGEIFGFEGGGNDTFEPGSVRAGRFVYGGPTLYLSHGSCNHELASRCMDEVGAADAFFGWVDRMDTIGTLAEIGAAYSRHKPIFLAFAYGLDEHFYFARQLATVAVSASSAVAAWKLFVQWQNRRATT